MWLWWLWGSFTSSLCAPASFGGSVAMSNTSLSTLSRLLFTYYKFLTIFVSLVIANAPYFIRRFRQVSDKFCPLTVYEKWTDLWRPCSEFQNICLGVCLPSCPVDWVVLGGYYEYKSVNNELIRYLSKVLNLFLTPLFSSLLCKILFRNWKWSSLGVILCENLTKKCMWIIN